MLEGLASLLDKSLLQQREQRDGGTRFRMLEVVREFALERLEASGEADAVAMAHARYFLRLVEEAEPELGGAEPGAWIERLGREQENLRAALGLLLREHPAEGARMAAALDIFWLYRSRFTEARGWLTRALAAGAAEPGVRAKLLYRLSVAERQLGNDAASGEAARAAVEASRAADDPRLLAKALSAVGTHYVDVGEVRPAREAYEEGLAIARGLGDALIVAEFFNNLGEAARMERDFRTARGYYEQALEARGRHLRVLGTATSLHNLGGVSQEEGDWEAAGGYYRGALAIFAELGTAFFSALALDGLAAVALATGDPLRAARLGGAAESVYETVGAQLDETERSLRDRYLGRLREALDPSALAPEWARGRALGLERAVAEALAPES